MSNAISLRVPKSLYELARKMAEEDGVSLNQWVMVAVAEKAAREQVIASLEGRMYKIFSELIAGADARPKGRW